MIKNHLTIAFRNLLRQFTYSAINIVGLAIGLACSAVIFMYVFNEWSYDRQYPHADRIYRVGIAFFNMGGFAIGPEVLGEDLPRQYEGVDAFTRISKDGSAIISTETEEFREVVYYTDTDHFRIFPRHFTSGNATTALKNDNSIVVTESIARKILGSTDVMGKTVLVGKEKKPFAITGIVQDDLRPSHLNAGIWLSIHGVLQRETFYGSARFYNYILLKEGQQQTDLENALDRLLEKTIIPAKPPGVPEGLSLEDYKQHPNAILFPVHALTDVHLRSNLRFEISPGGNEHNIYAFGAISLFVLLLAAVNFVNLSTARASRRAREVGIRKVIGSSRIRLIAQFLAESMLVAAIAMVFALFFGEAFLLTFELLSGSKLIATLWTPWNLFVLFAFTVIIGCCAGIYPAFYLTAFKPARVLKGNVTATGGGGLRNALVVAQFTISLCLMMSTAIIINQMDFMKDRDLGFDQQHVITIDNVGTLGTHLEAFENALRSLPGVSLVGKHSGEPGNESMKTVYSYQSKVMTEAITLNTYPVDGQLIPLMGFRIKEGRNFNHELSSDTSAVILNEAAVKVLGLENPVGADVGFGHHVVGVVHDYHWQSLRHEIAPSVFAMTKTGYYQISLRISNASASEVMEQVSAKWKELVPEEQIQYHFLDDNFGAILEKEKLFGKAVGFFTVLAIFVSCLGLYGLSAYTTEQRNKEIGIRKVMGASSSQIVLMLNKRFATLVLISVLIATPLAAYLMNKWLEGFAYRANLQASLFAAAIVAAFGVALITVSYHSIRASLTNPVDALKYE